MTNAYIVCILNLWKLSGTPKKPKIIFREAITPTKKSISFFRSVLYKLLYKLADNYVAVSEGVKKYMIRFYGINSEKIKVIYNPVVDDFLIYSAKEKVESSWAELINEFPVIIGMGRISPQKKFEDLIDAFAIVRKHKKAKLVIFGDTGVDPNYYRTLINKVQEEI